MKKLLLTFAFLGSLALAEKATAQAFLSVHPATGVGYHNDTVIAASTILFPVVIENTGIDPFFGTMAINIAIVDSAGGLVLMQTDTVEVLQGNMLLQGDTTSFIVTHTIDMQRYALAGNTTVIWPIAPGLDNDSATGNVYVIEPMGVIDNTGQEQRIDIRWYPNPTKDFLFFDIPSQAALKGIRVIDLTGKTVREFGNTVQIPLSDLPNGIYFAELEFSSGQVQTYKIVKQ